MRMLLLLMLLLMPKTLPRCPRPCRCPKPCPATQTLAPLRSLAATRSLVPPPEPSLALYPKPCPATQSLAAAQDLAPPPEALPEPLPHCPEALPEPLPRYRNPCHQKPCQNPCPAARSLARTLWGPLRVRRRTLQRNMPALLELFKGTGSIGRAFEARGWAWTSCPNSHPPSAATFCAGTTAPPSRPGASTLCGVTRLHRILPALTTGPAGSTRCLAGSLPCNAPDAFYPARIFLRLRVSWPLPKFGRSSGRIISASQSLGVRVLSVAGCDPVAGQDPDPFWAKAILGQRCVENQLLACSWRKSDGSNNLLAPLGCQVRFSCLDDHLVRKVP